MYATIFVLHLSNLSVISYELVFGTESTDIIMHLTIEILFDEYQRMSDINMKNTTKCGWNELLSLYHMQAVEEV